MTLQLGSSVSEISLIDDVVPVKDRSGLMTRDRLCNASIHNGRDHNFHGLTYLLAGGRVKPGKINGATEDFGFKVTENPVHVHDLHATVLHLLGLDHEKLTYRYSGRDFRLTDVEDRVVKEILE